MRGWRAQSGGVIQGEPLSWGGLAVGFPMQAGIGQPSPEIGFIVAKRLWEPHPEIRGKRGIPSQPRHCTLAAAPSALWGVLGHDAVIIWYCLPWGSTLGLGCAGHNADGW